MNMQGLLWAVVVSGWLYGAGEGVADRTHQAALAETAMGRFGEAERLLREAVKLYEAEGRVEAGIRARGHLGEVLVNQGRGAEAEQLLYRTLERAEAQIGARSKEVGGLRHTLGMLHWRRGELKAAARQVEESLEILEANGLAADAAKVMGDLAMVRAEQGRRGEALGLCARGLAGLELRMGWEHGETVNLLYQCAQLEMEAAPAEAERKMLRVVAWYRGQEKALFPLSAAVAGLGKARFLMERGEEGLRWNEEALELARTVGDEALVAPILEERAWMLRGLKRKKEAGVCEREAAAMRTMVRERDGGGYRVDVRALRGR